VPPPADRIEGQRTAEEVYLCLFTRGMLHNSCHLRTTALCFADEAFDRVITIAEVVVFLNPNLTPPIADAKLGEETFHYNKSL
jgi:hypothetical protein